jgi:DMSO/TMAO reductase YedYZ molybdopterin-dependent catalytic subunit
MGKIILTILLFIYPLACFAQDAQTVSKQLAPAEVKEYQGEKLSSSNDFRENSIRGPQQIDIAKYRLLVEGLVVNKKEYTYEELIKNHQSYTKTVRLDCVEGWSVNILWEGILVRDLLKETGVDKKANTVIFYAQDGYSTSFPLNYIMDKDIIMAYKMNGVTLKQERGFPFELVAENKWGYKWIKWITKIKLSDNKDYKGYWESRGYSNDGDVDKPVMNLE